MTSISPRTALESSEDKYLRNLKKHYSQQSTLLRNKTVAQMGLHDMTNEDYN